MNHTCLFFFFPAEAGAHLPVLEVYLYTTMRYINRRFTYLLTYHTAIYS